MSDKNPSTSSQENVILSDEKALLLDHNYDGIQELDHPLPSWWLAILYITIVFSVVYMAYYMTGWGPTLTEEMNQQLAEIEAKKPAAPEGGMASDVLLAAIQDPSKIAAGKGVYDGKCAACHGDKGQGLIGPNLTDDHWIHGTGSPADVAKVISEGVPDKGMPPWGPVITPDELVEVTAFIRSIHGSNPPNPKEPQGELHEFQAL